MFCILYIFFPRRVLQGIRTRARLGNHNGTNSHFRQELESNERALNSLSQVPFVQTDQEAREGRGG